MENEIKSNNPSIQPTPPTPVNSPTNNSKTLLFILLGFVVITVSVFVGIQIGKSQIPNQQPIGAQPMVSPTSVITNSPTITTTNWKAYENKEYGFSFKYPSVFVFKDDTGNGGDLANVPWKISLTSPTSIISSSVQKRQCNKSTGLPESEINIGNKSGIRFLQEDQMDGKLFSIDKVEVPLENKLCFTLEKYVSGKEASLNQNENVPTLKEMTNQDKDIFETVISTVNFLK